MSVWTNIENAASVEIKTIWNYDTKQWRVFYGLNGEEPVNELPAPPLQGAGPASKKGIYLGTPFTEATSRYILAANGGVDVDHFEIKSIGP